MDKLNNLLTQIEEAKSEPWLYVDYSAKIVFEKDLWWGSKIAYQVHSWWLSCSISSYLFFGTFSRFILYWWYEVDLESTRVIIVDGKKNFEKNSPAYNKIVDFVNQFFNSQGRSDLNISLNGETDTNENSKTDSMGPAVEKDSQSRKPRRARTEIGVVRLIITKNQRHTISDISDIDFLLDVFPDEETKRKKSLQSLAELFSKQSKDTVDVEKFDKIVTEIENGLAQEGPKEPSKQAAVVGGDDEFLQLEPASSSKQGDSSRVEPKFGELFKGDGYASNEIGKIITKMKDLYKQIGDYFRALSATKTPTLSNEDLNNILWDFSHLVACIRKLGYEVDRDNWEEDGLVITFPDDVLLKKLAEEIQLDAEELETSEKKEAQKDSDSDQTTAIKRAKLIRQNSQSTLEKLIPISQDSSTASSSSTTQALTRKPSKEDVVKVLDKIVQESTNDKDDTSDSSTFKVVNVPDEQKKEDSSSQKPARAMANLFNRRKPSQISSDFRPMTVDKAKDRIISTFMAISRDVKALSDPHSRYMPSPIVLNKLLGSYVVDFRYLRRNKILAQSNNWEGELTFTEIKE